VPPPAPIADEEAVAILAEDIFAKTIASVAAHGELVVERLSALAWAAAEAFVREKERRAAAQKGRT